MPRITLDRPVVNRATRDLRENPSWAVGSTDGRSPAIVGSEMNVGLQNLGPLSERDFRNLYAARAFSLLGDGLVPVALAFGVLATDDSPAAVGLVLGVVLSLPDVRRFGRAEPERGGERATTTVSEPEPR